MSLIIRERPFDNDVVRNLVDSGISPILARIFAARGIESNEDVYESFGNLIPHFSMKNISLAAEMVTGAIIRKEKIVILSDYDCDGATGCALGHEALSKLGADVEYFIPDRTTMGYGLSPESIGALTKEYEPKWIITVDNGISSVDGVRYAKDLGIGVIITDHHLAGAKLPEADAIINPNQPGCPFPSKYLSGVGVIFYFMLAIRQCMRDHNLLSVESQPNFANLLDLVAIGTIADMVPLDRNNRILVKEGMQRIRRGVAHPGVIALFQVARKDHRKATTNDISFLIAPRINAAGRISDMRVGIDCLIATSSASAYELAKSLNSMNNKRKIIEASMRDQAMSKLSELSSEKSTVVLYDREWHPGLVGLIANRIKDATQLPTIAFSNCGNSILRGSGRSISQIHIKSVFDIVDKENPGMLLQYGGHASAAGLTINELDLNNFTVAFEHAVNKEMENKVSHEEVLTDGSLDPCDINMKLIEDIENTVWGKDFSEPLFCNKFEIQNIKVVQNKHLSFRLKHGSYSFPAFQWNRNNVPEVPGRAIYQLKSSRFGQIGPALVISAWEND